VLILVRCCMGVELLRASPFYSPYLRCDSMSGDEAIGLA
jgi:hypothetical protein